MTQPPTQPPPGGPPAPAPPPQGPLGQQQGGPPPSQYSAGGGARAPRANFAQRLVAFIIDTVLLWVVFFILSTILGGALSATDSSGIMAGVGILGILVFLVIGVGYYVFFEGSESGQTIGKKAMNIRVLSTETGGSLGYGKAGLRYVGKIISSIPCYLGYLWMLWDQDQMTWHDRISASVVVPTTAFPVSKWP